VILITKLIMFRSSEVEVEGNYKIAIRLWIVRWKVLKWELFITQTLSNTKLQYKGMPIWYLFIWVSFRCGVKDYV